MGFVTLNNGVKMPILGFGVYQIDPNDTERCVLDAISVGYRSIDTAQVYGNEEGVGQAISKCGVNRKDLFITTKIWVSNFEKNKAKASIDQSLKKLQTDYVDLFLIHQPFGDVYNAYRALEDAYKQGKIKAIGVSNFLPDRFVDLASFVEVLPAVNQIEAHVFWQRKNDLAIAKKYKTQIMSWGPFVEGRNNFFENPTLSQIGKKYGKSVAQTGLRFLVQKDMVVIPKSVKKERMQQNFAIFDFELSAADMAEIEKLDQDKPQFMAHNTVETVEMMKNIKI